MLVCVGQRVLHILRYDLTEGRRFTERNERSAIKAALSYVFHKKLFSFASVSMITTVSIMRSRYFPSKEDNFSFSQPEKEKERKEESKKQRKRL